MIRTINAVVLFCLLFMFTNSFAQEEIKITPSVSEAAEGLDLEAVCELFKDSENLEAFEKSLNDPDIGVNNLDLNDDLDVDYIRVVEDVDGDTHLIILQVPLGYEEFQDVAVIEVVRLGEDKYEMIVIGNENLYGRHYYYSPVVVHIHKWPIIPIIFHPGYHPYRSPYLWGYYPRWYKPYKPVKVVVYNKHVVKYKNTRAFVYSNKRSTTTLKRAKYIPKSTKLVRKKTVEKKTIVKPARGEKSPVKVNRNNTGVTGKKPVKIKVKTEKKIIR